MSPDAIRKLALDAMGQDAEATEGPWTRVGDSDLGFKVESEQLATDGVNPSSPEMSAAFFWPIHEQNYDAELSAVDRTASNARWTADARAREPLLARALLALLPFVEHRPRCPANCNEPWTALGPCSCGFDTALAALGGEGQRANLS